MKKIFISILLFFLILAPIFCGITQSYDFSFGYTYEKNNKNGLSFHIGYFAEANLNAKNLLGLGIVTNASIYLKNSLPWDVDLLIGPGYMAKFNKILNLNTILGVDFALKMEEEESPVLLGPSINAQINLVPEGDGRHYSNVTFTLGISTSLLFDVLNAQRTNTPVFKGTAYLGIGFLSNSSYYDSYYEPAIL